MKKISRRFIPLVTVAAIIFLIGTLSGCSKKSNDKKAEETKEIRLATMTDEEGRILGEMMRMVLEDRGYKVDSKVGTFNNTTLVRQSIEQDQADLSLDYTGRGMFFDKEVDIKNYQSDLETAFEATKKADEKNGIIWLTYAPYNNTDGIVVAKEWADKNDVHTFEEFAKFVNDGGDMKLAVNGENAYVTTAETCLPGWEKTYGFKLSESQLVVGVNDAQSMASEGTDGVVAAHAYTTAGTLETLGLEVIEDTQMVSPVYSPAPIVSQKALDKYPELAEMFQPLFETIDGETIRHLNKLLSSDGISETKIAEDYLEEHSLVK